jgi:hypothetical protein
MEPIPEVLKIMELTARKREQEQKLTHTFKICMKN